MKRRIIKNLCRIRFYKGGVVENRISLNRETYLAEIRTKMDEADFSKFYEQGSKLKLEEAVAFCLEEVAGENKAND